MSIEDLLWDMHRCPERGICRRCFEEWQEPGLRIIGERVAKRKPRLNSPVRLARNEGYNGA